MSMNIIGTLTAIALAAVFFSVPLILKYHVYKPGVKHIVQGDIIVLEQHFSSVWCQGVHLTSNTNFQTFLYDAEPAVDENERVLSLSTHQTVLPNKAQEYWGFHLLRGSRVDLFSCARLIGGGVTVVKSHNALTRCLSEHKKRANNGDASGEESQSESESDEDTSSISSSQGAVMNDTEVPYICKQSINSVELPPSYKCSLLSHDTRTLHTLSINIDETAYYYFIFSSRTYLEIIPNEIFVEFSIDRTRYDYSLSSSNCSYSLECNMNITFMGKQQIVVEMNSPNGTLKSEDLLVVCKPREWIFFLFYAAFMIVIFICAFQ